MKFFFSTFFIITIAFTTFSQQLSDYEYIVVPEQFSFLDEPNEYGLNTATKQQLNTYGFKVFLGVNEIPFNVRTDYCSVLHLRVQNNSGLLKTKIKIVLEDCEGKIVFISEEGTSKIKEYRRSYPEAFREALLSFKGLTLKKDDVENSNNDQKAGVHNPNKSETITQNSLKEEKEVTINTSKEGKSGKIPKNDTTSNGKLNYQSNDGFYRMMQEGNMLIFFEGNEEIGKVNAIADIKFPVNTSEFKGMGYFKNGNFIVERTIKGVGQVEMEFIRK